ncbi:MAG TPA: VOC family protein [Chitinophagaceae bacterium]|jgi:PhnB protein|nr:VOC family protein [Chitinophagaceae bacterium]
MLHCTPFLLFDGNCAEAMTFYQNCLGGELTLTKVEDTPMKAQFPAEKHTRIIYAQLKSGAMDFSATDWMASPTLDPKQGNTFSIYVTGGAYEELKTIFDKLAQGADKDKRTFIELNNMPFGSYGQLTDKYGVSWIFKGEKKE